MSNLTIFEKDYLEVIDGLGENTKMFEGKTILLSGGCGFLGRYIVQILSMINEKSSSKPMKLIVLDNFITSNTQINNFESTENIEYIQHDITQEFKTKEKIDYIIHLAGIASPYYYRKYPLETLETATIGTKHLLRLGEENNILGFLYFSSSEIYGNPDPKHVPTKESYNGNVSCLGPRACYDESKRVGETLCKIFHDHYGVPTKAVRPFNVYGPGMSEYDYRVLPNFASKVKAGKALHVYADGSQTRTFCYITDAINGFLRALLLGIPGEVYNVGNPKPEVSMIEFTATIEKVLGKKLEINLLEYPDSYPPDEPMRRCPDITKAKIQLSYEPKISLEVGLKRYFDWALATYTGN